jgi:hypothetical protein
MVNEIPVPDESGQNIIYVRAGLMPWGIKNKVQSAGVRMGLDGKPYVDVGLMSQALMLRNIVRWEGPALKDFKLTPDGLDTLAGPHGDAVLAEINRQNPAATNPNGRSPTAITSTNAGATNTPVG